MESNVKPENTEAIGLGQRIVNFLVWPKLGVWLSGLFVATFLLWPLVGFGLYLTLIKGWQISGYYYDGLFIGIMGLLVVVWLASVIVLLAKRQFAAFLKRLIVTPLYSFGLFMLAFFISFFLFGLPRVSGWPMDAVYSPSQGKYYILAREPMLTDMAYRIYSTKGTLLNPVWKLEFFSNELDYSEDGSLISDPHLILSGDEKVLVVSRGDELTDALLLSSRKSVGGKVFRMDENCEQAWKARTARIRALLKAHETSASQPAGKLTSQDVQTALRDWADGIGKRLNQDLASLDCKVSCKIISINEEQFPQAGLQHVQFEIEGLQDGHEYHFRGDMSLVHDGRRLVIAEQDNCISYSNSREEKLAKKIRDLLEKHAGVGTIIPVAE